MDFYKFSNPITRVVVYSKNEAITLCSALSRENYKWSDGEGLLMNDKYNGKNKGTASIPKSYFININTRNVYSDISSNEVSVLYLRDILNADELSNLRELNNSVPENADNIRAREKMYQQTALRIFNEEMEKGTEVLLRDSNENDNFMAFMRYLGIYDNSQDINPDDMDLSYVTQYFYTDYDGRFTHDTYDYIKDSYLDEEDFLASLGAITFDEFKNKFNKLYNFTSDDKDKEDTNKSNDLQRTNLSDSGTVEERGIRRKGSQGKSSLGCTDSRDFIRTLEQEKGTLKRSKSRRVLG